MNKISLSIVIIIACLAYITLGSQSLHLKDFTFDVNGNYPDPYQGSCNSDQVNITIEGVDGAFCTSPCSVFKKCAAADPPATAQSQCALQVSFYLFLNIFNSL